MRCFAIAFIALIMGCGTAPAEAGHSYAAILGGDIVIVGADGSERAIFNEDRKIIDLAVDPTGRLFGYKRPLVASDAAIYVANVDGSHERRVTGSQQDVYSPSFSPDGRRLVYAAKRPGTPFTYDLYVADLDTMDSKRLINAPYSDSDPRWSPDGSRIAFKRRVPHPDGVTSFASDVCILGIDGTGLQCVTNTVAERTYVPNGSPAWSPDSKRIAYARSGSAASDSGIFVHDLLTGETERLTSELPGWKMAWSPDGTKLMYDCGEPFQYTAICVMDADGKNLREIARASVRVDEWVREGSWIR